MGTGPEFDRGSIETGRVVFRIRLQSPLCSYIFFKWAKLLCFVEGIQIDCRPQDPANRFSEAQ